MRPGVHSQYVVVGTQVGHSLAEEVALAEQGKDLWDVAGTREGE